MPQPRILAFAVSLRMDSYNKLLVRIAVKGARNSCDAIDMNSVFMRSSSCSLDISSISSRMAMT